jgi:hypothetical protein
VTLLRVMSFIWLAFALVGIILGAALLAAVCCIGTTAHHTSPVPLSPANGCCVPQFVTLMRVMSFIWLAFALVGIILGAALLAAADLAKPAPKRSYYGSSDLYSMATTTYGVLLAFGIILLLGGKHFSRLD